MKEYFVISDVHSFYNEMITALSNSGFSEDNIDHIVIVCGDLLDRGPDAKKVVKFFKKLIDQGRAILIRGNHEDLFDSMVKRCDFTINDAHNGTVGTLGQLQEYPLKPETVPMLFDEAILHYDKDWDYLKSKMVNYYELGNYIFVHAWIPTIDDVECIGDNGLGVLYDPNWRNAGEKAWSDARWPNGIKYAMHGLIEPGRTIVCGHYHTSYGHVQKNKDELTKKIISEEKFGENATNFWKSMIIDKRLRQMEFAEDADFSIFYDNGIIAIDACTAYTGFCNCLHLKESDIYGCKED